MNILVTGGAGYIGSHTLVELIESGYDVEVVDNFSNSTPEMIGRVEKITRKSVPIHSFDLRDQEQLDTLFQRSKFDAVMHFAGLKAVGESTANPLLYYQTNIDSTLVLLDVMKKHGVYKFIFSSSATVYGELAKIPYSEDQQGGQGIANPYGQTKYFIETILTDLAASDERWEIAVLRYFNPIGAHPSGLIGENPNGTPSNLMPYILQVASGERSELLVFGDDFTTNDGSGVRDYVHVVDIAKGHLAALTHLVQGISSYNLGSGQGTSVFELITIFEQSTGIKIPRRVVDRRPGDLPEYYSNADKALHDLGWKTTLTIEDACRDGWRWQQSLI